jgi:hypothetical protein
MAMNMNLDPRIVVGAHPMITANEKRITDILSAARQGLMPEVNSAVQIRALLNLAGMTLTSTPRVDVSKTKQGQRFRVHVGGHNPSVPSEIGTATQTSIFLVLNRVGCKDILVERIETGQNHPHHSLGNMSDGRGVGQPAMFIEFFQ